MMPGTMSATKINTRTCPGTSGKLRATRCPALTDFASEHVLHEVTHLLECLAREVAHSLHSASQCIAHLIHVRRQRVARDARGDSACCRQCDLGAGAHTLVLVARLQQCRPACRVWLGSVAVLRARVIGAAVAVLRAATGLA